MKKIYILFCLFAFTLTPAVAQRPISGVSADSVVFKRNGAYMAVKMNMLLENLEVGSNSAVLITPRVIGKNDSIDLPSVGIYSRKRYFHYLRLNGSAMISGENETVIRKSHMPDVHHYETVTPYKDWMNNSRLELVCQEYVCCGDIDDEQNSTLAYNRIFQPSFVYVRPTAETQKNRSLKGSAFIDYPVNKTVIYPEYRSNAVELAKITATIDSVKNDNDVRITSIYIKGYASPEGSYANNTRLAKGRTEALANYVSALYSFPKSVLAADYEPENWDGFKEYVVNSDLKNRDAILDVIASSEEPDAKEKKLRETYPDDYAQLVAQCFPALRRSDYKVEYVVRTFTDAAEIRRIIDTRPQKLSLEEFYIAAQDLQPGSDEYNKVFDVAVRMFPDDPVANLNAANASMAKGDLDMAKAYLDKSGTSAQATYARGVYAALNKDYTTASSLLHQAEASGVKEATDALSQLDGAE
ncbi:MAG: DUF3868 domain-containing protein [Prevotellaceae bacterium]|nr:DUF3868 domain-containing protein [Prevotellaceae bacterium]